MEENEEFDSDFNKEGVPISESFWKYMESYWHNHREFPESPEDQLKRKADLVGGKVPSSQLPSYVDDIVEFESFENLPNLGEKGKIYVLTNDNSQYRWSGSEYIQLNSDEHFMTVNTNQGISGIKNFFTGGGNYAPFNNTLQIYADDGSLPSMTYSKGGSHVGQVMFDINGFHFKNGDNDKYYHVKAQGFVKESSDDDYLLTGGGGHLNKYSKEDAWFHSSRNFLNGTLIETDIDYSGDYGDQFLLELKGNMYFDSLPLEAKIQGYIYNGTIIAQSGYSTLDYWNSITALNFNGKLCFWFSRMAYWQGFDVKVTAGYGGINQGKNRVTSVSDNPDPGGTKRVEIYLNKLLTKEELVSKNIFQPYGNYTTIDTEQIISASKEYYSSMPFKFKRTDAKSWVFHKPANNNLIFAPSSSNNAEDWNWSNQIVFNDNGTVSANGFVKNGSSNDYLLLGGGSHRLISDFALATDIVNTHKLDNIGAINNGSSTRINKSWFDYHWAETGKRGSVINFSGLNGNYSTELFAEYDNEGQLVGVRSKNGDANAWNDVRWLNHSKSLISTEIVQVDTTLDTYLPNGGFITSYSTGSWGGTDRPVGASFGGYIKHRSLNGDNNLDLYYNNGHNTSNSHRLWFRTKNNLGNTEWFEFWNSGNFNPDNYIPTAHPIYSIEQGNIDIWNNFTNQILLTNNQDPNNLFAQENKFSWINGAITGAGGLTSWVGNFISIGGNNQAHKSQLLISKSQLLFRGNYGNEDTDFNEVYHTGNFNPDNKVNAVDNAIELGYGGGGSSNAVPYVKHSNGTYADLATINWAHSQNYITPDFVEEKLNEFSGEITNPDYPIYIRNKFSTIIITEDYHGEPLQLEGELIPESYISIINLSKSIVDLKRFEPTIDRISEQETTEYYINKEHRLIKKGSYRNAQILI